MLDRPRAEDLDELLVPGHVRSSVVGLGANRDVRHLDVISVLSEVFGEPSSDDS